MVLKYPMYFKKKMTTKGHLFFEKKNSEKKTDFLSMIKCWVVHYKMPRKDLRYLAIKQNKIYKQQWLLWKQSMSFK